MFHDKAVDVWRATQHDSEGVGREVNRLQIRSDHTKHRSNLGLHRLVRLLGCEYLNVYAEGSEVLTGSMSP
jgi:hypothetical protein